MYLKYHKLFIYYNILLYLFRKVVTCSTKVIIILILIIIKILSFIYILCNQL